MAWTLFVEELKAHAGRAQADWFQDRPQSDRAPPGDARRHRARSKRSSSSKPPKAAAAGFCG